jgi:inhibitor of cysteine peptidase
MRNSLSPKAVTVMTRHGNIVSLASDDHGQNVEVSQNDQILLRLPENASTGYKWSVDADSAFLKIVSDDFEPPSGESLGAGGGRKVIMEPVAKGSTMLGARLIRSWEADKPRQQFSISITIG